MRRIFITAIAAAVVLIPAFIWIRSAQVPARAQSQKVTQPAVELAALGRIEGRGQTISVGAATDGVIKTVAVAEGDHVEKGALLAVIGCDDLSAQVGLAKAQADSARESRIRLLRGSRDEQRAAAAKATDAAKAVMMQAQDHLQRMEALYQKSEISSDTFAQAKRDFEVAQDDYQKALDDQNLTDAKPLPEEVSRADAEVRAAERNITVATEKLEKCNVRAPISGTILKVLTRTGESYSTLLPHALFTIADESVRRVRAEVDERDIGRVKIGQVAFVTADAYPNRKFEGQVVEISQAMGAKSVLSNDPAQQTDRDVLDVIIQMKPSKQDLPIGLRVTAEITGEVRPVALPSPSLPAAPSSANHLAGQSAPVAPAQQKAPLAAPQTPTTSAEFWLQAGAMKHTANANALAALLKQKSFPAIVITRTGDPFYRVDVGPYPDLASAKAAKQQLHTSGFEAVIKHPSADSMR